MNQMTLNLLAVFVCSFYPHESAIVLRGEFPVSEALADNGKHNLAEPLAIVHLASVVAVNLFSDCRRP